MILKFRVEGQTLFPLPTNDIPREGSRDYLKVDFDFGCGTEAYTKTVYFTAEEEGEEAPYSTAVIYEGEPIQVEDYFAQKSFAISVGFVLGTRSYVTNEISVPLDPASDVWLNVPPNLEIPAYQQLVQLAQESRDLAQEATEEASGATQIARHAADAAAAVTETAASALRTANIASDKADTAEEHADDALDYAQRAKQSADDALDYAQGAKQSAATAISMGNHIVRADASDGVSYVAPKSDTLPAIITGSGGTHKGKGTRIVFIPDGPNTVASPTLKIGDGEVIPIRLRSAANKGDNDQAPDATDDIPIGALMAGVPYAMTFCGKYWLIDSLIGGVGGGKIYVSDTKPEGLKPGDGWVDTSEELAPPVTQGQMETYVDAALEETAAGIKEELAPVDVTETVMEWIMDEEVQTLSPTLQLFVLAGRIYEKYEPGNYVAFDGVGKFEIYYSENLSAGGVRMKFKNSTAGLFLDELGKWNGFVFYCEATAQEMLIFAAGEPVAFSPTGLAEPTEDSGAANKKYVDDAIAAALAAIPIAEERSYG